ncbi:TPA: hypothetical protein DDW35_11250 [Candidatus Sumerlaeota bacterium]|nr:hypothetical protein [Candidatus Sumerlaeota bacterium]
MLEPDSAPAYSRQLNRGHAASVQLRSASVVCDQNGENPEVCKEWEVGVCAKVGEDKNTKRKQHFTTETPRCRALQNQDIFEVLRTFMSLR